MYWNVPKALVEAIYNEMNIPVVFMVIAVFLLVWSNKAMCFPSGLIGLLYLMDERNQD